jgi:hypothetical protein
MTISSEGSRSRTHKTTEHEGDWFKVTGIAAAPLLESDPGSVRKVPKVGLVIGRSVDADKRPSEKYNVY